MSSGPWARFDDMTTGTAQVFTRVRECLVAHRPDEVVPVLAEVERRTAAGAWAFGFVAYEAASGLDPALRTRAPAPDLPLVWFGICDEPVTAPPVGLPAVPARWAWQPHWDAARYEAAVDAVRERIAAGEVYQCNLTARVSAPIAEEPREQLYARLAHAQRGAHHAYLDLGAAVVASASPELFFELRGDRVLMRPMKGTAARGRTVAEDAVAVAALRASEKERAENVMIVDLVRNDLARMAVTGTVAVTALCRAERFGTVHQLTSDVEARLRPGQGLVEVFRALFPSGSVTGAPKISAMDLVAGLEDEPRGVYCGAIGVVGPPSAPVRARFSVAIRTVVLDRARGVATYGTGGGVTWGSDPAAEHAESVTKTAVLHSRPEEFHLVETLRCDADRGPVHLDRHLARMAGSASYFGFRFRAGAVRAALDDALRHRPPSAGDARIRLTAHRDGEVGVDVGALPAASPGPVRLALDREPVDSGECWPHHKTSRRHVYDVRRARHDADDVLLVNERGEVTESCIANLAVRLDGRWWTPPLGGGCLPGVGRAVLVGAGCLAERTVLPEDLRRAEGLALVSSLRGWRGAVLPDDGGAAGPTGRGSGGARRG